MELELKAKISDLVMECRYGAYKLLTFHIEDRYQILSDINRGLKWVQEVIKDDADEIEARLKEKPKLKPKLNRRPIKKKTIAKTNKSKKPIQISDYCRDKHIGFFKKKKK